VSTHYLVDPFTPSLATAKVIDVRLSASGVSPAQGGHIIRVPDEVSVQNPSGLLDLLNKKYAGLLAAYVGFTYVTYDDLWDPSGIDLAAVPVGSRRCQLGSRGSISFEPSSRLQTTISGLSSIPSQVYVLFELYRWTYTDPATGLLGRTYHEVDHNPTDIVAEASFDGGSHWYPYIDGGLLNIPLVGQGDQFLLRWTSTASADRTWLGSWAVIY
jgi:hypothetical protein